MKGMGPFGAPTFCRLLAWRHSVASLREHRAEGIPETPFAPVRALTKPRKGMPTVGEGELAAKTGEANVEFARMPKGRGDRMSPCQQPTKCRRSVGAEVQEEPLNLTRMPKRARALSLGLTNSESVDHPGILSPTKDPLWHGGCASLLSGEHPDFAGSVVGEEEVAFGILAER